MIRVLVADTHPVVRLGLVAILTQQSDITVPAEAATAPEACRLVALDRWDVIVLDPNFSDPEGPNGLELLKEIKRRHPKLPILVLGGYADEDFAARAPFAPGRDIYRRRRSPRNWSEPSGGWPRDEST